MLQRLGVPATIYVTTAAPDRTLDVWWLRLEEGLRRRRAVSVDIDGMRQHFSLASVDERAAAYRRLSLDHDDIEGNKAFVDEILRPSLILDEVLCVAYFLGWDELRKLTSDPLVTIGAHTVNHHSLADLNEDRAFAEMIDVRRRLTRELGIAADHFAYPFGSSKTCGPREFEFAARAGYTTAVTTRRQHFPTPRSSSDGPASICSRRLARKCFGTDCQRFGRFDRRGAPLARSCRYGLTAVSSCRRRSAGQSIFRSTWSKSLHPEAVCTENSGSNVGVVQPTNERRRRNASKPLNRTLSGHPCSRNDGSWVPQRVTRSAGRCATQSCHHPQHRARQRFAATPSGRIRSSAPLRGLMSLMLSLRNMIYAAGRSTKY